jgi:hypothetical protein
MSKNQLINTVNKLETSIIAKLEGSFNQFGYHFGENVNKDKLFEEVLRIALSDQKIHQVVNDTAYNIVISCCHETYGVSRESC